MGHFKIHVDTITVSVARGVHLCSSLSLVSRLFDFRLLLASLCYLMMDACCAYASAYTTARLLTGCLLTADQRSPLSKLFNLMATMRFYGASARARMNAR